MGYDWHRPLESQALRFAVLSFLAVTVGGLVLGLAGRVPVEGERGPHGAYYLGRGSQMPPLLFTNEEAVALVLGLRVIREFQFPVSVVAIEGAIAKTERVLPEPLLQQVRALQSSIAFNVSNYGGPPPPLRDDNTLIVLSTAAQERPVVPLSTRQHDARPTPIDPN